MRLTIRLLGTEVFHVDTDPDPDQQDGPGDCTTYQVGFTASHGDQRWESGVDLQ